jgi:glutamyl-tRNA synthetase
MRWCCVTENALRVRFCPSPTGNPHVGMVRTALFNWAFARHHGGTFVFRIEDTDSLRDTEQSYQDLLAAMRWLGLDWDEGPEVGGPYAPYRQSQRRALYDEVAEQLLSAGHAYRCYCTPQELEGRREAARRAGAPPGYDGHCRVLTAAQVAAYEAEGRAPAIRFRMPEGTISWDDLVRGELSFDSVHVPDYVIVRANGEPLYPLVNPVDDAAMRITHVLRGEDLLSSTPRQVAMYRALLDLGVAVGEVPRFGHLPYVMGEGNRKLSKRDRESSLTMYREHGYLPEGLLNYLALLGWSLPRGWPLPTDRPAPPGTDLDEDPAERERDVFTMAEMVAAFDIDRVNPNPARFDLKKCTAINADHIRWLAADDLTHRVAASLEGAGIAADPQRLAAAVPLVQERMQTLSEAVPMLGFLFGAEEDFAIDEADAKLVAGQGQEVLAAARDVLSSLTDWSTDQIEGALRASLIDGLGLKPRLAFGPVRVAITGRRVSPPLFESMELLGRDTTMRRIEAAIEA